MKQARGGVFVSFGLASPFVMPILLASASCSPFPVADVRHSHAEVELIQGARVVPADDPDTLEKHEGGYPHIAPGAGAVLFVMDSDANPDWLDSGNAQFLLASMPPLKQGARYAVGEDVTVYYWRAGARGWAGDVDDDTSGSVYLRRARGKAWNITVSISGAEELHHTFRVKPVTYAEFKAKFPPVTGWTQ